MIWADAEKFYEHSKEQRKSKTPPEEQYSIHGQWKHSQSCSNLEGWGAEEMFGKLVDIIWRDRAEADVGRLTI